jgi:hypothetical protein
VFRYSSIIFVSAIACIGTFTFNSHKWGILSRWGFRPSNLNLEIVKDYLQSGGDPNIKAPFDFWNCDDSRVCGGTVLHEFARCPLSYIKRPSSNERLEIVKLLIAHGANVNTEDEEGRTPLNIALSCNKNNQMIELLKKYGAKS